MAEQYSSSYVEEMLDEVKKMLAGAPVPPSLAIKNAIRNMLEMIGTASPTLPRSSSSAATSSHGGDEEASLTSTASRAFADDSPILMKTYSRLKRDGGGSGGGPMGSDHWSVTAECVVCGLDGVKGRFYKRGYKCERCEGQKPLQDRAHPRLPYGSDPQTVPSIAHPKGFFFISPDHRNNLFARNDSFSTNATKQKELSILPNLPDPLDPYSAQQVKYQVMRAAPVDDTARQTMDVLKSLVHPNIAYCFGSWEDKKRGQCWTMLEMAPTLAEFHPSLLEYDIMTPESSSLITERSTSPSRMKTVGAFGEDTQRFEWLKKVVVSLLQALHALQQAGIPHGDLRAENIVIDNHHVVKLLVFPVPSTTASGAPRPRLPSPYSPPEYEDLPEGMPYEPTFEGDMYTLGVTLSMIAFGSLRFPPVEERSNLDASFIALVEGMMSRNPQTRLTLQNAFLSPLLASVRLVNGVPVETMLTTIYGSAEEAQLHNKGACFITVDRSNGPAGMLEKFFGECGSSFQVVRTNTSCTLYSVKYDPRRRRATSLVSIDGTPNGLSRIQSVTFSTPPH